MAGTVACAWGIWATIWDRALGFLARATSIASHSVGATITSGDAAGSFSTVGRSFTMTIMVEVATGIAANSTARAIAATIRTTTAINWRNSEKELLRQLFSPSSRYLVLAHRPHSPYGDASAKLLHFTLLARRRTLQAHIFDYLSHHASVAVER